MIAALVVLSACSNTFTTEAGPRLDVDSADTGAVDSGTDSGDADSGGGSDTDTDTGPAPLDVRVWTLDEDAASWQVSALPPSEHAPTTPIEAAFSLEEIGQLWVLTRGTWHVMQTADGAWIDSGSRNEIFPEVAGVNLGTAWSIPAGWRGAGSVAVTLQHDAVAAQYEYDLTTRSFRWTASVGIYWPESLAPSPGDARFAWTDVTNVNGWAAGDPAATCGAPSASVTAHVLVATRAEAHVYDGAYCFMFVARGPLASFGPFALPGAPDPATVTAADWTGRRLVAFAP